MTLFTPADTSFASPDSHCLLGMMDAGCVFMSARDVSSAHQKGAAGAFVWVNYESGIKRRNGGGKKRSSPWIASALAGQFVTASKPPPAAPIRCARARVCVKVCAYLSAGWKKGSVCLPDEGLSHCGVPQQFRQRADQGRRLQMCCGSKHNTVDTFRAGLVEIFQRQQPEPACKDKLRALGGSAVWLCPTAVRPLQRFEQITAC